MTIRHLKIFTAVCESGSITKAAQLLYISQPAVSCAIKELESNYGIKLFDRISRRLYITESGKQLLDYAKHIVALFDEMDNAILNHNSVDRLRIGTSNTIGTIFMPEYVERFKELYPNTVVNVITQSSEIIEKLIMRNDIDFALIEGSAHMKSLISETYMDDELVVICNARHPFANLKLIEPSQFINEPFLLREKGSGTRELFDNVMAAQGYSITPVWESTSTQGLVNAVIKGLGISALPYRLVKDSIDAGKISVVTLDGIQFKRKFNIIYHKSKYLTKAARAFLDIVRKTKSDELSRSANF